MALPLSMFALVVIGAMVAGGFALALLEQQTGRNTLYGVQAGGAAEAGAAILMGSWTSHGFGALLPGQSASLPGVQLPGGTTYHASVHRLNAELFELRVTGTRSDADGGLLARRGLALILRRSDSAAPGGSSVTPLAHRSWAGLSP